MEALKQVKYPHAQSIRLWQTYCEDEGVRAVCDFAALSRGVTIFEMMNCKMTWLGCEFVSKLLHPTIGTPIAYLKLDHNLFGS